MEESNQNNDSDMHNTSSSISSSISSISDSETSSVSDSVEDELLGEFNLAKAMENLQSPSKATKRNSANIAIGDSSQDSDSSDGDSSDSVEEMVEKVVEKEKITSKHDSKHYTSFKLKDTSVQSLIKFLSNPDDYSEHASSSAPWHVNKNCGVVVDFNKMMARDDVFVDAFKWKLWDTYCVSASSAKGTYRKGNNESEFRVVKRTCKCLTHEDIEKQIILTYPPNAVAISRQKSITHHADRYALILYRFKSGEKDLSPAENPKTYPSVRMELKNMVEKGRDPKQATFEATKKLGGLSSIKSSSQIPKIAHAYEFNRQKHKTADDPLKKLFEKYHEDTKNGKKTIQTFSLNAVSYDIVLFNERVIKNIANFFCNDISEFKSPLCFDFTFDLGKNPPYFVLVVTFQNTTLLSKQTKKSPTMLGPVMICHKKDEETVETLCQSILKSCPQLKYNIKVIGADGEKSISNAVCRNFPSSLLLLCHRHVKENIRRHLPSVTEAKKLSILTDIFGNDYKNGLVDATTIDEFNMKLMELYEEWHLQGAETVKFKNYFSKYKEDELRFHVMKGAVKAAVITGNPDKFFNNNQESINKLIKQWQKFKKVDLFEFTKNYEELLECQESDVLRAFLGIESPYTVRTEFCHVKKDFNSQYANVDSELKEEIKQGLLNVCVDKDCYSNIIGQKAKGKAIQNARKNLASIFNSEATLDETQSACSQSLLDVIENENTSTHTEREVSSNQLPDFETILFVLSEALPNLDRNALTAMTQKGLELVRTNSIKEGFKDGQYFVKSYTNDSPHTITMSDSGIKCDQTCQRHRDYSYCSHALSVALKENSLQKFAYLLSRIAHPSLTSIASKNIGVNVGKKKPARERKRLQKGSPEKIPMKNQKFQTQDRNAFEETPSIFTPTRPNQLINAINRVSSDQSSSAVLPSPPMHGTNDFTFPGIFTQQNRSNTSFTNLTPYAMIDSVQPNAIFSYNLRDIPNNQIVLTLVSLCDKRVAVCAGGCQSPLKNGIEPYPPPFDIEAVAKIRRQFQKNGVVQTAPPSNGYFHVFHGNPYTPAMFCIHISIPGYRKDMLKIHFNAWLQMTDFHKQHLKNLGLDVQTI